MTQGPWIETTPNPAPERLESDLACDIAIVGGGIAGTALGRALAEAGADVVLLEGQDLASGASGRNAGFLLAGGARSFAHLHATHGPEVAHATRALGLRTRALVRALAATAPAVALSICGSLRLAHDHAEAAEFAETAKQVGTGLRYLERAELPDAWQAAGAFPAGLLDPGDGLLHPVHLVRALAACIGVAGGRVFTHSPVGALERAGPGAAGGWRLGTPGGTVTARRVILATSTQSHLDLPPHQRPVRAQMLEAELASPVDWPQGVYANGGADYWRARTPTRVLVGGQRAAGGRHEETADADPHASVQAALDQLLGRLTRRAGVVRVVRRWAGTMAFTPDGLPLAGRVPGRPDLYLLAGFNGQGMGWAPALASHLAHELETGQPAISPCFRADRFPHAGTGTIEGDDR